ncbi:MAG: UDP-2,3-diacylglucosamine diphosphatase LpxI [Sedimentisphaerales bacterium]|nr:UDP-2,3-diacylglucosamine diphosphatase LpxI [Sedimentisphaerales bacterium]
MSKQVLGLIAGQGRLPFLVAQGARAAGLSIVCAGLADNAEPSLAEHVDVFGYCPIARPGAWIRMLHRHGVTNTIMVGRVAKTRIYTPWRILRYLPDWRAFRIWYWRLRGRDKRNDSILGAIADELASGGIVLQDSTQYCREHLADEGVMTRTQPGPFVQADIEFGWQIVKKLGELDIGQAVAVKEREVLAVEAIEGTAKMIERAGQLCRKGGWTLIKVAKPNQDLRFDVPCVGPDTIESMAKYKASCLVVEKGRTIILDKPQTIALADKHKIAVVGH